jgi:transglutaminase-like putative cysteine protease
MIIFLARQAVGDSKNAVEAARRIESFVAEYITEKDFSVGYATAAEVAVSRQGDCSEHAVLTAAMCRAVGIPARVVSGLLYVEEFAGRRNVFGGHAWNQVYVGNKWVDLDASKATRGFGPGYITLAVGNGDPADFFGMVSTLGYFKIEKITINQ